MRLGAEESENTYLFTLKHDRSLARGCGGQGGESVSAGPGWLRTGNARRKAVPIQQGISEPHPEERRLRSQDGYVSQPSPPYAYDGSIDCNVNPRDISGHTEIPPVSE